ncbi:MAG: hypothetical protein N3C12_01005 [Candidatus Binatia bacterium]|nr:hypothetical protein [Candidatus Binatia bacterium]
MDQSARFVVAREAARLFVAVVCLAVGAFLPAGTYAYNCGNRPFGSPYTVSPQSNLVSAVTNYTISTFVPTLDGCDITTGTIFKLTFPGTTDVSGVPAAGGTLNGQPITVWPQATGNSLHFQSPIAVANGAGITLILNGIVNDSTPGQKYLSMSASPVQNGSIGATQLGPYDLSVPTATPTFTRTFTRTPTFTPTNTPTETTTPTPTVTPTPTQTATPTDTPTHTPTITPTPTPTATPSYAYCEAGPSSGCLSAGAGTLRIQDAVNDNRDSLTWVFRKGPALSQSAFGDPVMGSTSYALCIYNGTTLVMEARVGPSALAWKAIKNGYRYRDRAGLVDGYRRLVLKGGVAGRSRLVARLAGSPVPLLTPVSPTQFLDATAGVIVQLRQSGGGCYETTFTPSTVRKNLGNKFVARY